MREDDLRRILEVKDRIERAIELLTEQDLPGSALQLQKARTTLDSLSEASRRSEIVQKHDWRVVDPYTAQCRICGANRPLGVEERVVSHLQSSPI